jgi:hypothetical protein
MKTQQIKSTKPMKKPMSLAKRIILASDDGMAPQAIAELLGASLGAVYTVRSSEKKRRGGSIGTEHWFHQEIAKETVRKERLAKAETDWGGLVNDWNEVVKQKQLDAAAIEKIRVQDFVYQLGAKQHQINNRRDALSHMNKIAEPTPSEPAEPVPFSLPFFSRIKAAYAALRGV